MMADDPDPVVRASYTTGLTPVPLVADSDAIRRSTCPKHPRIVEGVAFSATQRLVAPRRLENPSEYRRR